MVEKVRRRSCSVKWSMPVSVTILLCARDQPFNGVSSPGSAKTQRGPPWILLSSSSAWVPRGMACSCLFLVRSAGRISVSPLISDHSMFAISPLRCPVEIRSETMSLKRLRWVSVYPSKVRSSASASTLSRDRVRLGRFKTPIGLRSRYCRRTAQLKNTLKVMKA